MADYKTIYIGKLVDKGFSMAQAVVLQEEVWSNRSRYTRGARDEAAVQGGRIYHSVTNPITNPINNPITHPITNPIRFYDSYGKRRMDTHNMLPRNGICEVCGKVNTSKKQFSLHHPAHDSELTHDAVIEVCDQCHHAIEGYSVTFILRLMEETKKRQRTYL